MPRHLQETVMYPCDEGFAVRFKRSDGRRLLIKVPTRDRSLAHRGAIELLVEALYFMRSEHFAGDVQDGREV